MDIKRITTAVVIIGIITGGVLGVKYYQSQKEGNQPNTEIEQVGDDHQMDETNTENQEAVANEYYGRMREITDDGVLVVPIEAETGIYIPMDTVEQFVDKDDLELEQMMFVVYTGGMLEIDPPVLNDIVEIRITTSDEEGMPIVEEKLLFVNDELYMNDGRIILDNKDIPVTGQLNAEPEEIPSTNGSSNFGKGNDYKVLDRCIIVNIEGEWHRFSKFNNDGSDSAGVYFVIADSSNEELSGVYNVVDEIPYTTDSNYTIHKAEEEFIVEMEPIAEITIDDIEYNVEKDKEEHICFAEKYGTLEAGDYYIVKNIKDADGKVYETIGYFQVD